MSRRDALRAYDFRMLSSGDELRLKLFRQYAANLSIHVPELSGIFACPICGREYREADVVHGEGLKVDIGHVFPEQAGGKLFTLECCECNGRLNRAADNELIRLHKQWDAMQPGGGTSPRKGYVDMPSGRVNLDVSGDGIQGHFSQAHPEAMREFVRAMVERTPVDLTLPPVHQGKVSLAVLHSAHLFLFRAFAYGYLLTRGGDYIRKILRDSGPLDDCPFMTLEMPVGSIDHAILYRAGVCTTRSGLRCLFVALPVPDPKSVCQFVLLPGPWQQDLDAYSQITAQGERWLIAQFQTIDGGPWERLIAPEYADALALLWNGMKDRDVDTTKIMHAVRQHMGESTTKKADAAEICARFGIAGDYLVFCVQSMVKGGYLCRVPKRGRPHLVRLTGKAVEKFRRGSAKRQGKRLA